MSPPETRSCSAAPLGKEQQHHTEHDTALQGHYKYHTLQQTHLVCTRVRACVRLCIISTQKDPTKSTLLLPHKMEVFLMPTPTSFFCLLLITFKHRRCHATAIPYAGAMSPDGPANKEAKISLKFKIFAKMANDITQYEAYCFFCSGTRQHSKVIP